MMEEKTRSNDGGRIFTSDEKIILSSVYAGDLNFYEAMKKLDVTEEQLEEMLELFDWTPSPSRIQELCEKEKETLSRIEIDSKPIIQRIPSSLINYTQWMPSGRVFHKTLNTDFVGILFSYITNYQNNIVLNYNQKDALNKEEFNYQVPVYQ